MTSLKQRSASGKMGKEKKKGSHNAPVMEDRGKKGKKKKKEKKNRDDLNPLNDESDF